MVTAAEGERLAILETKVEAIQVDVTEVKNDVKALVAANSAFLLDQATQRAATAAHNKSRGDLGVWVRASIPWIIAGMSLGLGLFNLLKGG
jgi:hypothetical protein